MSKRFAFHVEFDVPPKVGVRACIDHIKEAIAVQAGNLKPDNPLHDFDGANLKVRRIIQQEAA